jgi:hypothetical protein
VTREIDMAVAAPDLERRGAVRRPASRLAVAPAPRAISARPRRRRDFHLFLVGTTAFFLALGVATRSVGGPSFHVPAPRPGTAGGPTPLGLVEAGTLDVRGAGAVVSVPAREGAAPALAALDGRPVTANAMLVQSVASDRAFWVGTDTGHRVLVLVADGSGVPVAAGARVSFYGVVRRLAAEPAATEAVPGEEDRALLRAQGALVEIRAADLRPA